MKTTPKNKDSIEEIKILEISETLEGNSPVGKVDYWIAWANVKGKCTDVFETSKKEFPFEGQAKWYLVIDEREEKLVAEKDKIF